MLCKPHFELLFSEKYIYSSRKKNGGNTPTLPQASEKGPKTLVKPTFFVWECYSHKLPQTPTHCPTHTAFLN